MNHPSGAMDWLTTRIGAAAQEALEDHDRLDLHAGGLYDEVRATLNPKNAARARFTMVHIVEFHLVALQMMKAVLPLYQHPDSLVVADEYGERYLRKGYRRYIATPYAPVLTSGLHWHLQAVQAVLHAQATDPAHPYRLLPDQIRLSYRQHRGRDTQFDAEEQWSAGMEDVETVLQLLIARRQACSPQPSAEELFTTIVRELDVVCRGTSAPQRMIRGILPRAPGVTPEQVPLEDWPDQGTPEDIFANYDRVFEETDGCAAWRDTRLRTGPASGPWFCAGRYALTPISPANLQLTREFFDAHATHAGVPIPLPSDGTFVITTPLLLNVAAIAAQTLWA